MSRSQSSLEKAQSEVATWVQANAAHPRREEAERWLERALEEVVRLQIAHQLRTRQMQDGEKREEIRRIVKEDLMRRRIPSSESEQKTDQLAEKIARDLLGR